MIDLVRETRNCSFQDACAWLAGEIGAPWPDGDHQPKAGYSPRRPPALRPTQPRPSLDDMQPTAEVHELNRRVWELVRDLPLTPAAEEWLRIERGIEPTVAHAFGCRDWRPVLDEVLQTLEQFDVSVRAAAGFQTVSSGVSGPWWPIARLIDGDERTAGLAVPLFLSADAPVTWRWRFYNPASVGRDPIKCAAMTGAKLLQLGLQHPSPTRFAHPRTAPACVLVEGEPDFFSVADALERLDVARDVAVVATVATSDGRQGAHLATIFTEPPLLAIATHRKTATRDSDSACDFVDSLVAGLVGRFGMQPVRPRVAHWRDFTECDDANDWHRRGELEGLLEMRLAELLGVQND